MKHEKKDVLKLPFQSPILKLQYYKKVIKFKQLVMQHIFNIV